MRRTRQGVCLLKAYVSVLTLIAIISTVNCCFAQYKKGNNGYSIKGFVKGLPDGIRIFLIRTVNERADTVARSICKNGSFSFNGRAPLAVEMHFIILDTTGLKLKKGTANWVRLMLEDSTIQVQGEWDKWPELDIKGSIATSVYENYHRLAAGFITSLNALMQADKPDSSKIDSVMQKYRRHAMQYFVDHNYSASTPLLIMKSHAVDLKDKNRAYQALTTSAKQSLYGLALKKYIRNESIKLQIAIGKRIPDFKISTPDGKATSVLAIASKSEYTLIDFWASWCTPCRDAIPRLREVYDVYFSKGFNILGISTDKNSDAWKRALVKDGTKWSHGIDNVDGAEKNIFDIAAIPAYLLINKKGVLIEAAFMSKSLSLASSNRFGDKTLESDLKLILEQLINEDKNSQ